MSSSVRKSQLAAVAVVGLLAGVLLMARPLDAHGQDTQSEAPAFGCMEMGQPCDPLAVPDAVVPLPDPSVDLAHAKGTFDTLCVGCHEVATVTGQRKSREAWWTTMQMMAQYGMQASDVQQKEVLEYLSANYRS